jgi:hypothetical protein
MARRGFIKETIWKDEDLSYTPEERVEMLIDGVEYKLTKDQQRRIAHILNEE